MAGLREMLHRLPAIGLDELNDRAALTSRVDHKYALPQDELAAALRSVGDGLDILEVAGRRQSRYESVYFDTPDRRVFRDHVEDARPRWKARTRRYVDTGACYLELKVKTRDDETVKRRIEHDGGLSQAARRFLADVLDEHAAGPLPDDLAPVLVTRFSRVTLVRRGAEERVTIDRGIELAVVAGGTARLREDCAVVETKTPDGRGALDDLLAGRGVQPVSISKYRLGIEMLEGAAGPASPLAADFEPAGGEPPSACRRRPAGTGAT